VRRKGRYAWATMCSILREPDHTAVR
jgi:hypothetical protein